MNEQKQAAEDTLSDYVARFFLSISASAISFLLFEMRIPGLVYLSAIMLGFACLLVVGFAWQLFFYFIPPAIENASQKFKAKLVFLAAISAGVIPLDILLLKSHSFGYIVNHIDFGWWSILFALFAGFISYEITKAKEIVKNSISPFLVAAAFFGVLGLMSANNMNFSSCDDGDEVSCSDGQGKTSAVSSSDSAVEHYIGYILASFTGIAYALRKTNRI